MALVGRYTHSVPLANPLRLHTAQLLVRAGLAVAGKCVWPQLYPCTAHSQGVSLPWMQSVWHDCRSSECHARHSSLIAV